jgi:hypothetical protein
MKVGGLAGPWKTVEISTSCCSSEKYGVELHPAKFNNTEPKSS